ncbi:MAG: hypothetical protein U0835_13450 [Isosphaeraceae bacterium]
MREAFIAVIISTKRYPSEFHALHAESLSERDENHSAKFSDVDDVRDEKVELAVNGCLNEVCNGVIFDDHPDLEELKPGEWATLFPSPEKKSVEFTNVGRGRRRRDFGSVLSKSRSGKIEAHGTSAIPRRERSMSVRAASFGTV